MFFSRLKTFARKILSFFGSFYWRLRATRFFWWRVLNRKARTLYHVHQEALLPKEEAVLASLRERGIAIAHITDFFPQEVFEELRAYAFGRWQDPEVQKKLPCARKFQQAANQKIRVFSFPPTSTRIFGLSFADSGRRVALPPARIIVFMMNHKLQHKSSTNFHEYILFVFIRAFIRVVIRGCIVYNDFTSPLVMV